MYQALACSNYQGIIMGNFRLLSLFAVLLLASSLSTGCSVYLAMQGKEEPDIARVEVGSTRGQIELELGDPVAARPNSEGGTSDTYVYVTGDEKSAVRAVLHGAMDVITLCIWEVVGTPIELAQGDRKALEIDYDANDYAMSIRKVTPPQPAEEE